MIGQIILPLPVPMPNEWSPLKTSLFCVGFCALAFQCDVDSTWHAMFDNIILWAGKIVGLAQARSLLAPAGRPARWGLLYTLSLRPVSSITYLAGERGCAKAIDNRQQRGRAGASAMCNSEERIIS